MRRTHSLEVVEDVQHSMTALQLSYRFLLARPVTALTEESIMRIDGPIDMATANEALHV